MNIVPNTPEINIIEVEGQFMASSREVAEKFGKRHADVLRAVSELECSSDFIKRNFAFSTFSVAGSKRSYPYVNMTQDGFSFLAMGFTGREAASWKEKYIAAFNAMAAQLSAPTPLTGPQLMAAALIEADATMKVQAAQIEELTPKAAALDRLDCAEGDMTVRPSSKVLNYPERKLTHWLQANRWAFRSGGKGPLQGYVDKRNSGYLSHKLGRYENTQTGEWETSITLMITPKGLAKLAQVLPTEGGAA